MELFLQIILSLELALLFTHEMDAIRHKEWNMFIILKDMHEKKAYQFFMLLHVPLYALVLFLLFSNHQKSAVFVIDLFLIGHMFVHRGFKNHPANNLGNPLSKILINAAGLLAIIHLILSQW